MNRDKSGVARPWTRKFLDYSLTWDRAPHLRVSPTAVTRLKTKVRVMRGRGRRLADVVKELNLARLGRLLSARRSQNELRGSGSAAASQAALRAMATVETPINPVHELRRRGLDEARARASAFNGRGPWWNARRVTCTRPCLLPCFGTWAS